MDLNFSFSPSPNKRTRQTTGLDSLNSSPLKIAQAERIKNTARDLLSGALQEAIRKDEDEEPQSEAESLSSSLSSPLKRPPGTNGSPFCSPTKAVRKRKRKAEDPGRAFHHTFVMKLFDRSVDLAQFGGTSNYPLYPVCRAWMRNEPSNTSQAPVPRSPSPQMPSDGEDDMVSSLPRPEPWTEERSPRLPPPPTISTGRELDLDLDQSDAPPPALLLSNHLVRWWGVRKAWKQAALENEKRYSGSMAVIKEMFDK